MAIKCDNDENRYFIKLTPNSKEIYVNDGRSKTRNKPSKAYINTLEKQLTNKSKIKQKTKKKQNEYWKNKYNKI